MVITEQIQLYADSISNVEATGDSVSILLEGIDVGQVMSEFNADEVLDCFDTEVIQNYLDRRNEEDRE